METVKPSQASQRFCITTIFLSVAVVVVIQLPRQVYKHPQLLMGYVQAPKAGFIMVALFTLYNQGVHLIRRVAHLLLQAVLFMLREMIEVNIQKFNHIPALFYNSRMWGVAVFFLILSLTH